TLAAAEHELASARSTRAVEHERRRIAHDLHDVIAGHLSAVTLHTGLAASLEEREARDRSLSTARESARAALRDLQSMIGVLSTEDGGQLPVATLDWGSLAQRLRGRDPEAHIEVTEAATDPAQVEPSAQAALLRIASEAVTNAVRHGAPPTRLVVDVPRAAVLRIASEAGSNAVRHGAAPILLVVDVTEEEVSLVLENRRAEAARPGTGLGRGAIAHRAQAVGGQAESGAIDADRWRVQARLPAHPLSPTTSKEAHA